MYNPKPFQEHNPETLRRFIAEHPLATLIVQTENGLDAAHLPLVWHDNGSELASCTAISPKPIPCGNKPVAVD